MVTQAQIDLRKRLEQQVSPETQALVLPRPVAPPTAAPVTQVTRGAPLGTLTREQKLALAAPTRAAARQFFDPTGRRVERPGAIARPQTRQEQLARGQLQIAQEQRFEARRQLPPPTTTRARATVAEEQARTFEARTTERRQEFVQAEARRLGRGAQALRQRAASGFRIIDPETGKNLGQLQFEAQQRADRPALEALDLAISQGLSLNEAQNILGEAGRREFITPEERKTADESTLARTRALAVAGGAGTQALEADESFARSVIGTLDLSPDTQLERGVDGTLRIRGVDIELDPFKRAEKITEIERQRSLNDINEAFGDVEKRINERFKFATGPRAGQLTDQGKRQLAELLADKKQRIDRAEEGFKFKREAQILQEAGSKQRVAEAAAREVDAAADPAKALRLAQDEALLARVNEKLASGEATDVLEAVSLVKREVNILGKEPGINEAFNVFSSQLRSGQIQPENAFNDVLTLPGVDGNIVEANKVLRATGFSDLFIKQKNQEYQTEVLGIPEEFVREADEFQGNLNEFRASLEGASDPLGIRVLSSIESLAKNDTEDNIIARGLYSQVLASPTTNPTQKIIAQSKLDELEEARRPDLDIRGSVKEGFVQITQDPTGRAVVTPITKPRTSLDPQGGTVGTPAVEAWVDSIIDGSANISNIPSGLRNAVNIKLRDALAAGRKIENLTLNPAQLKSADTLASQLNRDKVYLDSLDVVNGFDTILTLFGTDERIQSAVGFDDVTAINAFQRMIDPGATVREGDVTLLKTTIPFLARISPTFRFDKFKKGDVLPPDVRRSLFRVAKDVYDEKVDRVNRTTINRFKIRAEAQGIPFEFIGSEFTTSDELIRANTEPEVAETRAVAPVPLPTEVEVDVLPTTDEEIAQILRDNGFIDPTPEQINQARIDNNL